MSALNFRKATDDLFARVSVDELADAAGCSVQTIKQARMDEALAGSRPAPTGWERAALKLAEAQAAHFTRLAARLRASEEGR